MSSFKLPSFSFSSKDDGNDDHDKGERKSRSLFSSLTGGGSSSSNTTPASSLRSPSPYAGRHKYKEGKEDGEGKRKHHRPWKRHHNRKSSSHSDVEYAGATSSANVSEAESDGEGVLLSRLTSNSSSGTASSSNTNNNAAGVAPLTSTSSNNSSSVSFAGDSPAKSSSGNGSRSARFAAPASTSGSGPQVGRGAPRNAYYDDSDADDDDDGGRPTTSIKGVNTSASDTLSPADAAGRSVGSSASSQTRMVDASTQSDSEEDEGEASHGEYTQHTDEEEDYYSNDDDEDLDPTVIANTEANAGSLTAAELLSSKPALLAGYGDDDPDAYYYNDIDEEGPQENWPNLVKSPASPFAPLSSTRSAPSAAASSIAGAPASSTLGVAGRTAGNAAGPGTTRNGRGRGGTIKTEIPLVASRPVYERNRCSITLTHGDPDSYVQEPGNVSLLESGRSIQPAGSQNNIEDRSNKTGQGTRKKRKGKTYVVASDLSEESYYAIEWAIGTVLRSGDELLFVTVMETDSKLDPEDGQSHDKTLKIRSQQERQTRTMQLSREATALLERTRLHVRVKCQAIHAKNARHMLIDLIDYFAPTLVIIGSRGLSRLKGIILGSVSHYLIQKSSAPVMVTRRRLKPLRRPPRPISDLQRQPRVGGLANATIDVESHAGMVHQSHAGSDAEDTDADSHRLHRDTDTGGDTETERETARKIRD